MISIEPLGDCAYLAHLPDERSEAGWARALRRLDWKGVTDVVLAYRSVAVFTDPDRLAPEDLGARLQTIDLAASGSFAVGRLVEIPVLYDGEDLPDVADRTGLTSDEVIALHSGTTYEVFAIGFLPGFPYAGYLPDQLSGLARRESPRVRVPAGSVAIAGRQTGIYPGESPGGWHLLGRTPIRLVDLEAGVFAIQAGDRIRFHPILTDEFEIRRHDHHHP